MVVLKLFATAAEAAGRREDSIDADDLRQVLDEAVARYGCSFADLLPTCRIWVNGETATATQELRPADEVAVLPPVSGG